MHRSCTSKARWEYLLRLQLAPVPLYFTVRYWSASEPLACLKQTFHQGIPGLLSVSSARASTYLRLPGLLAPTLARSLSLSQHSIALPSSVTHSLFLLGFAYSISYATPLCFYHHVSSMYSRIPMVQYLIDDCRTAFQSATHQEKLNTLILRPCRSLPRCSATH